MPDEPTGTPEAGTGTPSPEASTPEPWAPVSDRVNELAGTVHELRDGLQQFMQANAPQPDPEPDPWEALFQQPDQPGFDPYAQQPEPQQPVLDPQALQQAFQQAVQQQNAPLMAQIQHMQLERAHEQLVQRIPQLADKPENQEIRDQTVARVRQSVAAYPPEIQQALINNPGYIETIFKAAEAEKLAAGQAPASGQVPALETAGGALPGGNSAPVNPVHQAYGGRQGLAGGFS